MPLSIPSSFDLDLFPLGTVLFPGGSLPLQIFEVRYLDMIGRCQNSGSPFGVVGLVEGSEVRRRSAADEHGASGEAFIREAFHTVGTLAVIESVERPQPGLMNIRCRGTQRFRLHSSELLRHGLWTGSAELLAADPVVPVPDDLQPCSTALQRLFRQLQADATDAALLPTAPHRWQDCDWVANRWCELLPLGLTERQRLMALDNPLLRLELVADRLDRLTPNAPGVRSCPTQCGLRGPRKLRGR